MNFYFTAAETLERIDARKGSIKGILGGLNRPQRPRVSALVIETLKYKAVLTEIITTTKLMKEERKLTSLNLALVLVHDLLLAKGIQAGDGPVKQAVLRHKTRLHSELQKLKIKRNVRSNAELAQNGDERAAWIPRYVRVNMAIPDWSTNQAVQAFAARGYELSDPLESKKGFDVDAHIPNLLRFFPGTQFQDDILHSEGKIILQDKASCFPAVVLAPPADDRSVVIDATAAPGNKTSHLSALMLGRGKLFAFERDPQRFKTLNMMLGKARCRNVEPVNADFLTVDPKDTQYVATTHILLDPSCSGSGIVNRLDYLESEEENDDSKRERLAKLSAFQLAMIKHAMTFPAAVKIVYSTCSIHAQENEHVVRDALMSEEARTGHFTLAPPAMVLPQWRRRGVQAELGTTADAASLVRCSPDEDATNGFFVSCFIKGDAALSLANSEIPLAKRKADDDGQAQARKPKRKKKNKKKAQGATGHDD